MKFHKVAFRKTSLFSKARKALSKCQMIHMIHTYLPPYFFRCASQLYIKRKVRYYYAYCVCAREFALSRWHKRWKKKKSLCLMDQKKKSFTLKVPCWISEIWVTFIYLAVKVHTYSWHSSYTKLHTSYIYSPVTKSAVYCTINDWLSSNLGDFSSLI